DNFPEFLDKQQRTSTPLELPESVIEPLEYWSQDSSPEFSGVVRQLQPQLCAHL
ncbi:hypothetical protein Pmar_PMAR016433, partial [Perkinsus marinus ATCC 50983]